VELRVREIRTAMMTFPIKKRINTELFVDRIMAAFYSEETRIRVATAMRRIS